MLAVERGGSPGFSLLENHVPEQYQHAAFIGVRFAQAHATGSGALVDPLRMSVTHDRNFVAVSDERRRMNGYSLTVHVDTVRANQASAVALG